jgi:D-alanyl-D-alanine carboxypeptidase (penicillin-binding protein 5/6)
LNWTRLATKRLSRLPTSHWGGDSAERSRGHGFEALFGRKTAQRRAFLLVALIFAGCAAEEPPSAPGRRAELWRSPVGDSPPGASSLWPAAAPSLHARSAIMIDARSGLTLYQKNADERTQVASTQKLLTALVILRKGSLENRVVISPDDTRVEPSKLGVRPGQWYTRRMLLSAMLVKSENDAAAALARDCFGNLATFAAAMNTTAWELGAHDSHFVNPHGLPAYQYSTARDMARIAFRAYREPFLRRLVGSRYFVFVYATGRSKVLENTNKLLKRSSIFNGMKTGYTNAAGRCLISSASMGGREVILAQFGSKTQYIFDDAERMMRWGLAQNGLFRLAY